MPSRWPLAVSVLLFALSGATSATIACWVVGYPPLYPALGGALLCAIVAGGFCWAEYTSTIPFCPRCQEWHRGRCRP